MAERVAFLGGGRMGEALVAGLLRGGAAPDTVAVAEKDTERAGHLVDVYGIVAMPAEEAAAWADTVVVAVKPDVVGDVLTSVADHLQPHTLVVSIAAGLTTARLAAWLPDGQPVVRVMPNTPAFVGQGMSVLSPGAAADETHLDRTEALLAPVGRVLRVDESKQDAVTAVSGSGPAYVFYLVEAMVESGVQLGLPRDVATELAVQTAFGAATMLRESGQHPVVLRENVTSPGGTTAAAVRELEAHGVRGAVYAALQACRDRSRDLAGD